VSGSLGTQLSVASSHEAKMHSKLQREGRRGALCASLKRKFLSAQFTRQLTLSSPDLAESTTADVAVSTAQ
jgi:hypothetical protein